ncbi:hypothetical protein [Aggregatilinea lenta]|uniref:hypothetical protein n=1 Tax=Aggregatilinea lenta TaxID=913108 RepID=UPI0013C2DDC3|nr:hypothetical protein [Aggregatilinea lenta]
MVATALAVGFGASLMMVSGYISTTLGLPLFPNDKRQVLAGYADDYCHDHQLHCSGSCVVTTVSDIDVVYKYD